MRYDLIVIGSGPAGQKGAIAATKMGRRVALVERNNSLGGVCLHQGTIPSKTMREATLYLTGYSQRQVYGDQYRKKRNVTIDGNDQAKPQAVDITMNPTTPVNSTGRRPKRLTR